MSSQRAQHQPSQVATQDTSPGTSPADELLPPTRLPADEEVADPDTSSSTRPMAAVTMPAAGDATTSPGRGSLPAAISPARSGTVAATGDAVEPDTSTAAGETVELDVIEPSSDAAPSAAGSTAPLTAPADSAAAAQSATTALADLNATVVLAHGDPPPVPPPSASYSTTELPAVEPTQPDFDEVTSDELADDVGWEVADQPTIQFAPPLITPRPAFLETGEQPVWPPRPTPQPSEPFRPLAAPSAPPPLPPRTLVTPQPNRPMPIPRPIQRPVPPNPQERLASPTGRRPLGDASAAYSDPRMRRYVELRLQRGAHDEGKRGPTDNLPVTQLVRQWWSDLLPGLQTALDHQHDARASGVYPIPAHEPTAAMRLGDAFGRLTAAVRDITERAQSAAMPTLNRLHERAEHAAQAIVDRFEGSPARQQAPLLGPGRLAVFFRQGVTVGQAQRLLLIHEARPMRLIPRRHGFLAKVAPGQETAVASRLNQHPYVRDVVFLEYDEDGQPIPSR